MIGYEVHVEGWFMYDLVRNLEDRLSRVEAPIIVRSLVKSGTKNLIFLFLNQNICCGCSKEPSQ